MIIWNITSSYEKKCTISLIVSIYFNNNVYALSTNNTGTYLV